MHYVVLSGTLTSACSLPALLTYVTMPNTFIFLGISFLLTKLYISSYMAMLNARKQIRDQDASSNGMPTLSNLRRLRGKPVKGTIIESISHKVVLDSFHLPAIGYNSKPSDAEKGYQSVDLDVHKDIADTSAIIGIKIHTIQERRYDENADTNS
ncbi:hypothetical protein GALMADRAFT_143729 [Galerina marginata CBS 339.88]|uniref:DUF6534 domain-containing protein n=1 Tax=Galerina marginata (strain CBS 339.88) TaxID=685588 RepID=A0A067SKR4_GALM3|nr:hypothetical protein GALMADRAFT_143729 [Galerina marginata CBS 339.88]